MAVKSHLTFKPNTYSSQAKGPFEATGYHLFYFAADADDAARRPSSDVSLVLNRSEKWNCTLLKGCQGCYEFIGPQNIEKTGQVIHRLLPCPCHNCYRQFYQQCTNKNIVDEISEQNVSLVEGEDCQDFLEAPLDNYSVATLKAFMELHNVRIFASAKKKSDLIKQIIEDLSHCVITSE